APESAIFASNTSSISITNLAAALPESRRANFVGMHFFSPVPVMPLIELIRGEATGDPAETYVREIATELNKKVIVSQDRPGFIVNRVLMPFLAESMRAYEEGLATAEDIDTGAKVGLNHPMGPLELADFIGLDVCLHIMEVLRDGFGEAHFAPPDVLRDLVEAGHLGQKTGRGFYTYPRP
ncbi:MAG: 3-hydroxyacyl-CoA dehydrogenase family protein, partial [Chloroflexota bacterium]